MSRLLHGMILYVGNQSLWELETMAQAGDQWKMPSLKIFISWFTPTLHFLTNVSHCTWVSLSLASPKFLPTDFTPDATGTRGWLLIFFMSLCGHALGHENLPCWISLSSLMATSLSSSSLLHFRKTDRAALVQDHCCFHHPSTCLPLQQQYLTMH